MTEEIDYKALYEGLASELEETRRRLFDMHFAANRVSYLQHLSLTDVRGFVFKNYLLIIVTIMLFGFVFSSLSTLKGLFKKP
jgi:hypothetical protein